MDIYLWKKKLNQLHQPDVSGSKDQTTGNSVDIWFALGKLSVT